MKKLLFSALLVPACLSLSHAQSTMTAANANPIIGDEFYGHYCDTDGVSAGSAGAHITWNFSALAANNMDTITYVSCASTPYCGSFTGSNIAQVNAGDYSYGVTSSSKFSMLGAYTSGMAIVLSDPMDVVRYPLTYNSTYIDTFSFSFSGLITHIEVDSYKCDGYGTLVLPGSTDTNALRVQVVRTFMDSSAFGGVTYGRTVEYMWYRPGFHNPLLNITYDTAGGTTPYVSDVVYHTSTTPSTGITNLYSENNVSLYPNPASDVLNVRYNLAGGTATINIADITGHVIFATNENLQAGQHDIKIPVQMLGNGMYLLQMTTAEGTTTRKFTIAK